MTATNTDQTCTHAQLGAQPIEQMPIETNHADLAVVLRVMNRAAISQDTAARSLNINKGHMSRMLSGDAPVAFQLVRYLWDRTSDLELLDLLGGPDSRMRLSAMRRDKVPVGVDIAYALPTAILHLAEAAQQSRSGQPRAAAELLESALCLINGAFETACCRALGTLPVNTHNFRAVNAAPANACCNGKCVDTTI